MQDQVSLPFEASDSDPQRNQPASGQEHRQHHHPASEQRILGTGDAGQRGIRRDVRRTDLDSRAKSPHTELVSGLAAGHTDVPCRIREPKPDLEDPLPAGLEPIDTSLDITSEEYRLDNNDRTWTHVELHDERVALFATFLRTGTYTYHYLARATIPGEFHVLPGQAYPMYYPEVYGRGGGARLAVEE